MTDRASAESLRADRPRVRPARGDAVPPGVGGRRRGAARAAREGRARQGLLGRRLPGGRGWRGRRRCSTRIAVQEAMFEAGASSGLMAALFTGGIALPHIAASGDARPGRPVRPPDARRRADRHAWRSPSPAAAPTSRDPITAATARRDGDDVRRQRRQDVHHQRRARRLRDHRGAHRRARATAASSCSSSRRARPASPSTGRWTKMGWHCSDTAELVLRRRARPRRQPGRRGEHRLRPDRASSSSSSGSRWRCTATASPPAALGAHRGVLPRARDVRQAAAWPTRWCGTGSWRCAGRSRSRGPTRTRSPRATSPASSVIAEACLAKQTAVDVDAYCLATRPCSCTAAPGYLHGTEVERHYRDARILPHRRRSNRGAHRSGRPTDGLRIVITSLAPGCP